MIIIIAAIAENNAIGKDNRMLWHLPDDFKRFKKITMGHTLIMGRKTFESIGGKPLPGRPHIVITRKGNYQVPEGVRRVASLQEALELTAGEDSVFIIGGGQIYGQALRHADVLDLTLVHTHIEDADTFFPEIDPRQWVEVSREEHPADSRHAYAFSFVRMKRRNPS